MVKNYVNMFGNDLQEGFNNYNPLEKFSHEKKHIKMTKEDKR